MSAQRRPIGGLENDVLTTLGAAGGPLTPAQVLAEIGGDLAYTTVLTTLTRMHRKGLLERERAGRAYAYAIATDSATFTARRMRRLLERDADRAQVLARFVAELDPDEERLLAGLLSESPEVRR